VNRLKIAYFDCFSGISGDMCLGAIIDSGISTKELERALEKIPIGDFKLISRKVKRACFKAVKVDVVQGAKSKKQKAKKWKDVEKIIQKSSLSHELKQKGRNVFKRIFQAEAQVHGKEFDQVHLHELGAIDCIIDIFGTMVGLDILGIQKVYSSPVNLGSGFVKTEAKILPVPAPATVKILKNVPVYSKNVSCELTTPTGAAIIKELSSGFGEIPAIEIEKIGIGAGSKDFKDMPNVLRLLIGNRWPVTSDQEIEKVTVIETNIDDMNPQVYEYVMGKLLKMGALDVYLTHILMKKGRPGIKLTVLCSEKKKEDLIEIIFNETSTIGLRFYEVGRKVLQREIKTIDTEFGKVRIKFSRLGDDILKLAPEYKDCRKIAKKLNIPLIDIIKKIV
jgi:uncharacterized protein (TIGR00299 family) protein